MSANLVFFLIVAGVAVISALGMLLSRKPVYSALYLIVNFSAVALLYLFLSAPFIAIVQITVYTGAIMVLFLFVIMLLGAEASHQPVHFGWPQLVPFILAAVLLAEFAYLAITHQPALPGVPGFDAAFGDPKQIGKLLFNEYMLPFEITSILLLSAMVGAIVLTKVDKPASKRSS